MTKSEMKILTIALEMLIEENENELEVNSKAPITKLIDEIELAEDLIVKINRKELWI